MTVVGVDHRENAVGSRTPGQLLDRGLRRLTDTVGVTDAARLAVPFPDGKPPPFDGVLDVYLASEISQPEAPIAVARLHMNGVTTDLLALSLRNAGPDPTATAARFADLRVVMRIIPSNPGVQDFGVVVVRDEAGNVFSSDTTGALPQDRTWLARRAGHTKASPARQQEGAVALVNDLLKAIVPREVKRLTTDAA